MWARSYQFSSLSLWLVVYINWIGLVLFWDFKVQWLPTTFPLLPSRKIRQVFFSVSRILDCRKGISLVPRFSVVNFVYLMPQFDFKFGFLIGLLFDCWDFIVFGFNLSNLCGTWTDIWNGWKGVGVQGRFIQQVGFPVNSSAPFIFRLSLNNLLSDYHVNSSATVNSAEYLSWLCWLLLLASI